MASNDYVFITNWQVEGTCAEVFAILDKAQALPEWWPSVYLRVEVLREGDALGVGKLVDLYTKGWLPYTLRWQLEKTVDARPYGMTLHARGDFVGQGIWTLQQQGPTCRVQYDWRIRAGKPLLRRLSWLAKPVFAANHRWAMARGEESLKLELRRRAAQR